MTVYGGYWVDPYGYARYVLFFIAATLLIGVAIFLASSMVLPVPDDASRETGKGTSARLPVRRGRGRSVLQDSSRVRDISASGVGPAPARSGPAPVLSAEEAR